MKVRHSSFCGTRMATESIAVVHVRPQFQRSVRLDIDADRADALNGYILQPSSRAALDTVASHLLATQQRAFTWTGPYGGGKSSLALAMAMLAGGTPSVRRAAKEALHLVASDPIAQAFFAGRKPWLVLPIVGRRALVQDAIAAAIDQRAPLPGRKPTREGNRDVIAELVKRAESSEHAGVLVVLDELGKFLEAAAFASSDIYFYQELAEAASRSNGKLVIVGILHQAFEQYASRLGREAQQEWAKIQGRYVDVPIVAGSDEMVELIGRALETDSTHPRSLRVAEHIAASIHRRRPSSPPTLADALDRCWPLHPVTAALLGPSSRRKFGQNERSVFGFLTSAEPLGFRDYLASGGPNAAAPFYQPSRYWDYLRANLESAILASPDGHRWAVGAEAVERVESRFVEPHIALVKTIGLIELFRNGSGLVAETDVLAECVPTAARSAIEAALEDLSKASILVYRKHLQAWGIFAGSDFDIEASVAEARAGMATAGEGSLRALAALPPVTARRHYVETGTLRWFDREVMPALAAKDASTTKIVRSRAGRFVLLLPSTDCSEQKTLRIAGDLSKRNEEPDLVLYGVPYGQANIMDLAAELAALEHVARNKPELHGDAVARREIDARLRQLRIELEGLLRDAFSTARWYFRGTRHDVKEGDGLSPLASVICDDVFPHAPRIHSELVNRDALSSSAAKAQRTLLHRMLSHAAFANLDYHGYPADAGLYYTVLTELGLHQAQGDHWGFVTPSKSKTEAGKSLVNLWHATNELLERSSGAVSLAEIYALWTQAPFGLKQGVLPILALAFLLAHRSRLAVYVEGVFVPDLTDAGLDEWLQDPSRIAWKQVRVDASAKRLLTALAQRLEQATKRPVLADPLDSARALVSLALALPHWTRRTDHVSARSRSVRTLLLRASDPIKVIFSDLPELLGTRHTEKLVEAVGEIVDELNCAYPAALSVLQHRLLKAIDHEDDLALLRERAGAVRGVSGDFLLDAFASRLQNFTGTEADVEGLVSLAVSKPPQAFTDHDMDQAKLQFAKWAFEFRRVEALSSVAGRSSTRQALAVVFGSGKTISGTFDVAESDHGAVRALADTMLDRLLSGSVKQDVFLAALVQAGSRVLDRQREEES
jgi:hypothetical protein